MLPRLAMAVRGTFSFTAILFSSLLVSSNARANDQRHLGRGSSISTQDDTTTILVSPNGAFSCGFYKVATNAFTFSIWFSWSSNKTVAWTANCDAPVNGKGSKLTFQKNGGLELIDYDGAAVWSTNTTATRADRAMLLNRSNLVIMDPQGQILWGSFDSPTDTLLPWQPMTRNTRLVSAISKGLLYSGSYTFYFNSDNVLTLIYNDPDISSIYWPNPFYKPWEVGRSTYNSSQHGVLDQKGHFLASDQLEFEASDFGDEVMRRLTLDYDGNLRLYSLNKIDGSWLISWLAFPQICEIHGVCGVNGLCTYIPKLECLCLKGFEMVKPNDWSKGCRRKGNRTINGNWSKGSKDKANSMAKQEYSFRKLRRTDFWGFDFNYTSKVPFRICRKICMDKQGCQAFAYREGTGECFPKALLFNGKPDPYNDIYLRIPYKAVLPSSTIPSILDNDCKVTEREAYPSSQMLKGGTSEFKFGYFLSSALTLLLIEVVLIIVGCWVVYKWERRPEIVDEGYMIISSC